MNRHLQFFFIKFVDLVLITAMNLHFSCQNCIKKRSNWLKIAQRNCRKSTNKSLNRLVHRKNYSTQDHLFACYIAILLKNWKKYIILVLICWWEMDGCSFYGENSKQVILLNLDRSKFLNKFLLIKTFSQKIKEIWQFNLQN